MTESQSRSIAACGTDASASKSDALEITVVFPDPIDPEMTNTGTFILIPTAFRQDVNGQSPRLKTGPVSSQL
ncbi:MAG: hypothetical protein EXR53_03335 [Dehalococcoidia bacterium]|nr:hypothetical protein [Dehalococcoidia bacterium]